MDSMMTHIDLNSDMGERDTLEGLATEAEMMPFITSVNIACGGHAGTADLMRRTAQLAAEHGVAIGAHPGLRDPEQFGRRERNLAPYDCENLVTDQIETLVEVLGSSCFTLTHVKPHGALYNMAANDPDIAQAVVRAVQDVDRTLFLYALAGSVLANAAQAAGLHVVHEAFADRAYKANGTLVPRSEKGALLQTEEDVRHQLRQLMIGAVASVDGPTVPIRADSICLHCDTPHTLAWARMIRHELSSAGIRIAAPCHDHR
jgi:UPF0271 protein